MVLNDWHIKVSSDSPLSRVRLAELRKGYVEATSALQPHSIRGERYQIGHS